MYIDKNNITKSLFLIITLLITFIIFIPSTVLEAKVMVHPTRISFENEQRSAILKLINTEDETITYRISFVQSKMNENGEITNIQTPDKSEERLNEMMAQDLIRYSPRQVTLPPGETQLIRLQLNKPQDLAVGEYRSRLLFQEIPAIVQNEEQTEEDTEGFSIQLKAIYGVSIPVIVRHGETWGNISLSDLSLNQEEGFDLSLKINREGNRSVYGDLEVIYISDSGEEKIIGKANRIAVYTDVNYRWFNLSLEQFSDIDQNEGTLKVIFRRPPDEGGQILAESEIRI